MDTERVSGSLSEEERGGGAERDRPPRQLTWVEAAEEQCAVLVSAGLLTPAEFWRGDYSMLKHYRAAYRKLEERENYRAWLHGLYVYEAVCDASPILRDLSKARRPAPYPGRPYEPKRPEKELSRAEKERRDYETKKSKVEAWAAAVNAQFARKKAVKDHAG